MDFQTTSARLRRTFQYPTDESSIDTDSASANVLDEEEQDDLIATLAAQNATRNAQFRRYMLALPSLASIAYLPALLHPRTMLLALLAISSLTSTTYLVWQLPPDVTGITPLDRWIRGGADALEGSALADGDAGPSRARRSAGSGYTAGHGARRRRSSSFSVPPAMHKSPLETWLPILNGGLCSILIIMGALVQRQDGPTNKIGVGIGNLPAIVYAVVLLAKGLMASVDPERELNGLKYEYKGA